MLCDDLEGWDGREAQERGYMDLHCRVETKAIILQLKKNPWLLKPHSWNSPQKVEVEIIEAGKKHSQTHTAVLSVSQGEAKCAEE